MKRHPFPSERVLISRDQDDRVGRVRALCAELHDALLVQCPETRERSVAITNLEQVFMWANKSIVMEESA